MNKVRSLAVAFWQGSTASFLGKMAWILGTTLAYILLFETLHALFGHGVTALTLLPVLLAGLLFGLWGGVISSLLSMLIGILLLYQVENHDLRPVFQEGGTIGFLILMAMGPIIGWLRDLHERSRRELAERKYAEQVVDRRNRELSLLNRVITATTSSLDVNVVLETTVKELALSLGVPQAGAALLNASGEFLQVVAEYPPAEYNSVVGATIPIAGNQSTQYVLEHQEPLAIENIHEDPRTASVRELLATRQVTSILILPLVTPHKIYGTIGLDYHEPKTFSQAEIQLAANAAIAAAQAVENASLYAQVQQLAISDSLTGLYNRRGLEIFGDREIERHLRYNRPLTVIFVDLDHFKQLNDTHGHRAGDSVLQWVAECCLEKTRGTDLVVRYGGDEFAILLPETELPAATQIAERICRCVANSLIPINGTTVRLTASLGVARACDSMKQLTDLIDRADQAMYKAKSGGRNRLEIATEERS